MVWCLDGGLSILHYADGMILFMDHNLEHAHNIKIILCIFEQLSGLKINFHKNRILCFGGAKIFENQYMELFGCNPGTFPIHYLGIPIHYYKKLSNDEWMTIQERLEKRLSSWKRKFFRLEVAYHLSTLFLVVYPCTWCPTSKSQKGFAKSWITSVLDFFFFCKVTNTKENIG